MRVFALSDIHVDYQENEQWLLELSLKDYQEDILILAGDVTDNLNLLERCFRDLSSKFQKVLFVPGNHELWVHRDSISSSIEKYQKTCELAMNCDISMQTYHSNSLSIVPLLSWYDFSFGQPSSQLEETWMDFRSCSWPEGFQMSDVTNYFLNKNKTFLKTTNQTMISFSHFLPRIDLMPIFIPPSLRYLYPVLGTVLLEKQIRKLKPQIHVYGHSHVNCQKNIEGIQYINNAFGYPAEKLITNKELLCIYELSTDCGF